jgi:putative salt-induced outer membrane protein YdiY
MEAEIQLQLRTVAAAFAVTIALHAAAGTVRAQEPAPPPPAPAPVRADTVPAPPGDTIPATPATDTVGAAADAGTVTPPAPPVRPAAARASAPASPWKVSAEMSYNDQTGNRVLRLLTGGLKVAHRDRTRYELDGRVESRYGKSNGEVVARNHYASLALDLRPEDVWSPFVFFNGERDEFKRLNLRFSGGAGAQYRIYDNRESKSTASVSLALLYSFEDLIPTEAQPFAPNRSLARWSLRVKGNQALGQGISLQHSSFYQPVWDEVADYLLRSESGAKVLLTKRLALSVGYQLSRNNRPPDGVQPDDRLLKTGFIIDF